MRIVSRRTGHVPSCSMLVIALFLSVQSASAATIDWQYNGSTSWGASSNWIGGTVPGGADAARIGQSGAQGPVIDGSSYAVDAIFVGDSGSGGSGSLLIQNGGVLTANTYAVIGFSSGLDGDVTVTGPGSTLNVGSYMYLGYSGNGSLNIENGGTVNILTGLGRIYMGTDNPGGTDTLTISGPGSSLNLSDWLLLAYGGNNTFHDTTSIVELTDGAVFNAAGIDVGYAGHGILTVGSGSVMTTDYGIISAYSGSKGEVTIDGAGSRWSLSEDLVIASYGEATLDIRNGGVVESKNIDLAELAGSTADVTVSGDGSALRASDILTVGGSGSATLTLDAEATAEAATSHIGYNAGSTGMVTVSGTGTTWNTTGGLHIGYSGEGSLLITDSGTVSAGSYGAIGTLAGSVGSVTVDGSGSSLVDTGQLYVGYLGSGDLTVANSGSVQSAAGYIGLYAGGSGSATIRDTGSHWTVSGTLEVGSGGDGVLEIADGGNVSTTSYVAMGTFAGSTGSATVTGAGSALSSAGVLYIAYEGVGTLTLADHGEASSGIAVEIASVAGSVGTLNIGAAAGAAPVDPGTLQAATVSFGAGTGAIVFNHTDVSGSYIFAPAIDGTGSVGVHSGTTVVTGQSSYFGPTTIYSGMLSAGGVDVLSANSDYAVLPDGTLNLDGYDNGVLSLDNAGTVRVAGPPARAGAVLTAGAYASNGGELILNTVLGSDASLTDRLVAGSIVKAAGGATRIFIQNVNGAGAQTYANGIMVVQALDPSQSASGAFVLGQRVAAGAYEYNLYQGGIAADAGDGSWYLRNTRPDSPDTPDVRVEVPVDMVIPPLALEYGYAMLDTLHERVGETWIAPVSPLYEERAVRCRDATRSFRCTVRVPVAKGEDRTKWASSGWARLIGERGFRDNGNFFRHGADYNYTFGGLQAGLDLYGREQADGTLDKAGIYAGYGQIASDVKGAFGGKAGTVDMDAYTLGGYWTHFSPSGWYTDAVVQGTWYSADAKSVYNQRIKPEGFGIIASLEGGYAFKLGDGWSLEPQAQLAYQHVSFDNARDQYGFVSFNDGESLRGRLGARLSRTWNAAEEAKPRLMTAWIRANVWHEFLGDAKTSFGSLDGANMVPFRSSLGGTWGEIGAGLSGQVTEKVSLFATAAYNRSFDNKGRESWDGRLGMTVKW